MWLLVRALGKTQYDHHDAYWMGVAGSQNAGTSEMKMNRRASGILAWTGLVLVIGVPIADTLLHHAGPEALSVSVKENGSPTTGASVPTPPQPAAKNGLKVVAGANALDITPVTDGAGVEAAATAPETPVSAKTPTPSVPAGPSSSATPEKTDAAGVPSQAAAPAPPPEPDTQSANLEMPYPDLASGPDGSNPGSTAGSGNDALVAPIPIAASERPTAPTVVPPGPSAEVTGADLKDWKSGSLADYLKQRGLVESSQAGRTTDEVPPYQSGQAGP